MAPLRPAADAHAAESYRTHFRLLREGLASWIADRSAPAGMPAWPDFLAGVTTALDHVREHHQGDVLVVTSGGPLATAVTHVLAAPPQTMIARNLRIRNSSVPESAYTPQRHIPPPSHHPPRPASPALAASMAAFRAKRFVWSETSWITERMFPMVAMEEPSS